MRLSASRPAMIGSYVSSMSLRTASFCSSSRVAPPLGLLELPVEVVQLGLLDVRCRLLEVAAAGDGNADHDADGEGDEDRSERGDVVTEIEHAGLAFRGHEESWR